MVYASIMLFSLSQVNEVDAKIASEVREFYLGDKEAKFDLDKLDKIIQMFGDAHCFGGQQGTPEE